MWAGPMRAAGTRTSLGKQPLHPSSFHVGFLAPCPPVAPAPFSSSLSFLPRILGCALLEAQSLLISQRVSQAPGVDPSKPALNPRSYPFHPVFHFPSPGLSYCLLNSSNPTTSSSPLPAPPGSSALKCGFYSGLVRTTDQEMIVSEKFVTHSASGERCRPCHTGPHGEALGCSKGRGSWEMCTRPLLWLLQEGTDPLCSWQPSLLRALRCAPPPAWATPALPSAPRLLSRAVRRSMLPEPGCSLGVGLRQCGFSIQQHLPTRLCGSQQTLVDICKHVSKPLGDSVR